MMMINNLTDDNSQLSSITVFDLAFDLLFDSKLATKLCHCYNQEANKSIPSCTLQCNDYWVGKLVLRTRMTALTLLVYVGSQDQNGGDIQLSLLIIVHSLDQSLEYIQLVGREVNQL